MVHRKCTYVQFKDSHWEKADTMPKRFSLLDEIQGEKFRRSVYGVVQSSIYDLKSSKSTFTPNFVQTKQMIPRVNCCVAGPESFQQNSF